MPSKYKVGDLVKLKSGSPKMTVEQVSEVVPGLTGDQSNIECQWFSGTKLQSGWFNPQSLEPADAKDD